MKLIPLTQGQFAKVDDEDFERVSRHKWQASSSRGGFRATRKEKLRAHIGQGNSIYLHREIMMAGDGVVVDHINHDALDNRRSNLRICTNAENLRNRLGPNKNSTGGIRGVTWLKRDSKWKAQIKVDGKNIQLGVFVSKECARDAYVKANVNYFGAFGGKI